MRVGRSRLPPGGEQVAGDLAEEPVVGGDGVAEADLDPSEVAGQRRESHLVDEVAGQGCLASASLGAPWPQPCTSTAG